MKKYAVLILAFLSCISCKKNQAENVIPPTYKILLDSSANNKSISSTGISTYDSKIIAIENLLINGNKIILPIEEFKSIYTKIDSTKTKIWECGSPFEWLDEQWMTATYGKQNEEVGTFENFNGEITTLYSKNIEHNTNNHIVLFNKALAENNTFEIISHKIRIDKSTTLENFKKQFPNCEIEKLENPNESRIRFSVENKLDDAFLFYFKDGKLDYLTLWWLLC